MKILQVIPRYAPAWAFGGGVRIFWLLASELARRGHTVTAVSSDAIGPGHRAESLREELTQGVSVIRFRNRFQRLSVKCGPVFFRPLGMHRALNALVQDVDVVHMGERAVHNIWTADACVDSQVPLAWSPYGGLAPATGVRGAYRVMLRRQFKRRVLPHVERFIAQSQHEAQACLHYGAAAERILQIPLCVDPTILDATPSTRGAFRRRYGISTDAPLILCVARLHPAKGIDILIRAFARLNYKNSVPVLAIVGWDEGSLRSLKSLARYLGVQARVIFTGGLYGDDRVSAYVDADVFALTSRFYEETSVAALEAAACGTPTVITAQCEIPGLATAGGGIVVDAEVDAVVRNLDLILSKSSLRQDVGMRGSHYIRQNLTVQAVSTRHEELFQELLRARGGHSVPANVMA